MQKIEKEIILLVFDFSEAEIQKITGLTKLRIQNYSLLAYSGSKFTPHSGQSLHPIPG